MLRSQNTQQLQTRAEKCHIDIYVFMTDRESGSTQFIVKYGNCIRVNCNTFPVLQVALVEFFYF
jgi:hypothetical protein